MADTAVVQDAATLLVSDGSTDSLALLCDALSEQDAAQGFEVQVVILQEVAAARSTGETDVIRLLREIQRTGDDSARSGARLALGWLSADA